VAVLSLGVSGVGGGISVGALLRLKAGFEVNAVRLRPHPWEFALYYDI